MKLRDVVESLVLSNIKISQKDIADTVLFLTSYPVLKDYQYNRLLKALNLYNKLNKQ